MQRRVGISGPLMGTFLMSRLGSGLAGSIPLQVTQALPPDAMAALDPQALVSPQATRTLEAQFAGVPDGARLLADLMGALRTVLATSIHDVFLVAAVVAFGGVLVAVFLPEKPLRGRQPVDVLVEAGKELAAEGVGTAPPIPAENEPRLYVAEVDDTTDRQPARDLQPVGGRARDDR